MIKKVNIGLLIEQRMNELGISKSELSRRCGIMNQNINRVFAKQSIDTDKLIAISEALDFNFFDFFHPTINHSSKTTSDMYGGTVSVVRDECSTSTGIPIVPAEIAELPDTDVYELVKEGRIGSAERLNPIGRYIKIDMYWRVRDDAMMPRYIRDDILALANFPEGEVFPNGSPMVVGMRSCGFVFRRVHDVGDALECRVANADSGYADTVIPKSQVIRLYRVVGMVRTGF